MKMGNESGKGKLKNVMGWGGESCNLFGVDGEYTKKAPLYEI